MSTWSPALMPRQAPTGPLMDLDEWAALGEDEEGELVEGRLTDEEMPDHVHELAVTWLIALLVSWLKGRGGFVLGSEIKVKVGPRAGRKPDVSVVLPGSPAPARRGLTVSPPDIVVEVVSPSPRDERRDRVEKMTDYAAAGIRFYWIVDPGLGSFEIFELDASARYARVVAATEGKLSSIPGCDGLTVDIDDLWTELDRLAPETT